MFRGVFLWLIAACFCLPARAQKIVEAEIGINGLTCSQCSRSVEQSLRRLDFIENVTMDLEHTEGRLLFKENKAVDPGAIAKAVKNAGFSVRSLHMVFLFDNKLPSVCFDAGASHYQLIKPVQDMQGKVMLQLLGNAFQPKKEYRNWQPLLKNNCNTGAKVYFLTTKAGKV